MVRSTTIVRASDALPLAASVDDEQTEQALQEFKQQSKLIFRRITPNSEPRCSIESGPYTLHYLISDNVVYLTIAEKSYPRKLAFSYLDELSKEFAQSYGAKVDSVRKPYAFVGFDTFMAKTARLYQDTRTASAAESSLEQLNGELQDVTRIMTKNMEELLWRGDSLDRMSHLSTSLRSESEKYRKATQKLNFDAMLRHMMIPYISPMREDISAIWCATRAPLSAHMLPRVPRCILSTTHRLSRYSTSSPNTNKKTFDTDELGIPKTATWTVHGLLNSYPPTKLSDETLIQLHNLAALIPPKKDSSKFASLQREMVDLVKLVEAVRTTAPLSTTASPESLDKQLDGRIWPEERSVDLRDYKTHEDGEDCSSTPPDGRELLRLSPTSRDGFYIVDSSRVKD